MFRLVALLFRLAQFSVAVMSALAETTPAAPVEEANKPTETPAPAAEETTVPAAEEAPKAEETAPVEAATVCPFNLPRELSH